LLSAAALNQIVCIENQWNIKQRSQHSRLGKVPDDDRVISAASDLLLDQGSNLRLELVRTEELWDLKLNAADFELILRIGGSGFKRS
jgi:hypothetical protein